MLRFFKIAGLLIAGQIVGLIVVGYLGLRLSPRADPVLSALFFIYTPMISAFERTGHYVGCANFIEPVIRGVPVGMLIYGFTGAAAVCLLKKQK